MARKITHAIVRQPGTSFINAITSSKPPMQINYNKALEQHANYCKALQDCGVKVMSLPITNKYPDSCFVEDVAICTPQMAVLTLPGDIRRKDEVKNMKGPLKQFYNNNNLFQIIPPGTLDGGDVMEINGHYYIGISNRTNENGANQLIQYLNNYGYTGSTIQVKDFLHLKSSITYLENDLIITTSEFSENEHFKNMNKIIVQENIAANCIWINDTILIPQGCSSNIKDELKVYGYNNIHPIDMSEYNKVDGALTCLSLRI